MILFVNGFEITQWGKHELTVRNKSCYKGSAGVALIDAPVGFGTFGFCVTKSFQENKQGYVYSPSRELTSGAPYYQGQRMSYWDPVKNQIEKGFNDNKLFFINGSSDNRTTGNYRFTLGVEIGKKIINNWTFQDDYINKLSKLLNQKEQIEKFKHLDLASKNALRQLNQMSLRQLDSELLKSNLSFRLEKNETLKLIGHSMGGAIVAGIASEISKHPIYNKKIEVVLYLAPHQPQQFIHPTQVLGYQSSSSADLVASKNEIEIPVSNPNPLGVVINNWLFPKNTLPYSYNVSIPISWAKGTTAYQLIKNIPKTNFIENKTYDFASQNGHGVYTYIDELEIFFKLYRKK